MSSLLLEGAQPRPLKVPHSLEEMSAGAAARACPAPVSLPDLVASQAASPIAVAAVRPSAESRRRLIVLRYAGLLRRA